MVKKLFLLVRNLLLLGLVVGLAAGGYLTRDRWLPLLARPKPAAADHETHEVLPVAAAAAADTLELSQQARKNLQLVSRPARLGTFRRTIDLPGRVVDRPGRSDRGVTSPAVGIVTMIHAFPGDTVGPGDRLFTLRLLSEYIQTTQSELFKVTREIELENEKRNRLAQISDGAIAPVRLIEVDQQLRRLAAASQSYRQELLARGLSPEEIDQIVGGQFVTSIDVAAPQPQQELALPEPAATAADRVDADDGPITYEVQELTVELGSQVQAGQLLAMLADHRQLFIAGHAFKRETPLLERAARAHWPIEVEFAEDDPTAWPALGQTFEIQHFSNTIDPETRTLDFFIPLINQASRYTKAGSNFLVWRFRPGQRVRLHVPVEELEGVIVLPAGAVVQDGPEAYVFRQNGDLFKRLPVHLLHADRRQAVLANDGSVAPGWYLAQSSAAILNRVLKEQTSSGMPVGVHVHADGTVHDAH